MARLLRCALLVLGPVTAAVPAAAQGADTSRARLPFLLGVSGHAGFIIPHSQELVDVSGSHPFGIEVELAWLMTGEQHTRRNGLVAKRGFSERRRALDERTPPGYGGVRCFVPPRLSSPAPSFSP